MQNEGLSKGEILIGIILAAIVCFLSIFIADAIRESVDKKYLQYSQALKTTEADKFVYGIETGVGNILVYGDISATTPQTMKDIKGKWSILIETKEKYTMHTRQVSYSCGKNTCYRTETYYSWDYAGEKELKTNTFKVLGTEIPGICTTGPLQDLDLDTYYEGNKKQVWDYIYPDAGGWTMGDVRYSYMGLPAEIKGSVFIRAFEEKIVSPLDKQCIPIHLNEDIETIMKEVTPDYATIAWGVGLIALVILLCYFYIAYKAHII